MSHWATRYIGKSWCYGAQGPDAYDCWNFVCEVQRTEYGINMPLIDYGQDQRLASFHMRENPELHNWNKIESPIEGDIVMMARAKIPAHIGVWIVANGKQGILHCLQGVGVVFQQASMITISGWGSLQYYRRKA